MELHIGYRPTMVMNGNGLGSFQVLVRRVFFYNSKQHEPIFVIFGSHHHENEAYKRMHIFRSQVTRSCHIILEYISNQIARCFPAGGCMALG